MQQQRNFVLFTILSMVILIGWLWIQNQIWPPPPRVTPLPNPWARAKLPPLGQVRTIAHLVANRTPLAAPVEPVRFALDLGFPPLTHKLSEPVQQVAWKHLSRATQRVLAHLPPWLPSDPLLLGQVAYFAFLAEPPPPPAEKTDTVVLGNGDSIIQAVLSTRGAGIQKLTLNPFQAADWMGLPERDDKGARVPLELIQEDPLWPSFLLYHFPDKDNPPVLGLGEKIWKLESNDTNQSSVQEVRFSTRVPGLEHVAIVKTYRLAPHDYHVGLTLEIRDERDPKTKDPAETFFRYQLTGAHGMPIEGEWYTSTFRNAAIAVVDSRGNVIREFEDSARISHRAGGDKVVGTQAGRFLQYAAVCTQFFASSLVVDDKQAPADEGGVDPKKILAWARPTRESMQIPGRIKLVRKEQLVFETSLGVQKYIMLPRTQKHLLEAKLAEGDRAVLSFYELEDGTRVATWIRTGETPRPALDDITVRVHSEDLLLRPGDRVVHRFLLYHGPVKVKLLGQFSGADAVEPVLMDRYAYALNLRTLTDYGRFMWWTDLVIACTNLMHVLLNFLRFAGNGLSIILLTVLVRGLMFPISRRQAQFSVKMQEIAPELKKLQEKYKNDPRGRTEATMELYRKHSVHPLGGCLPIFLQMPIFIGLYFALQESIHFRLASFLWMPNLAAPDMLIFWGQGIPVISDPDNYGGWLSILYLGPFLNILPIIAVSLMIVQQKIMTPPPQDEQQEMQFKMMRYMMVFFGLMFYKVAAGLCLYFISSSLWGLAERRLLPKKPRVEPGPLASTGPRPGAPGRKAPPAKAKDDGLMDKARAWWADILEQARKK